MLTKEFIEQVFYKEFALMTLDDTGKAIHPYVGFALISQAIEILGACFDEYSWEDRNLSALRFNLAIDKLFDEQYKKIGKKKVDLYNNLRCPMVHQMRPGKKIGLSQRSHEIKAGNTKVHLTIQDGKTILIYEDFLADFQSACKKVIQMIEVGKLTNKKVNSHNISVPEDKKLKNK